MYAERIIDDNGKEGIGIFIDASHSNSDSPYFRYIFDETYKIIAPNWTPFEFEIIQEEFEVLPDGEVRYPDVRLVPRAREEMICYRTDPSRQIILSNTLGLEEPKLERFLVRFIPRDNPILSHRYSILIQQFGISRESYTFYENLKKFSSSSLVFSQIQPGLLEGNIRHINGDNKAVGYFDIATEITQRIYFNYTDFFAGEDLPPYFGTVICDRLLSPPLENPNRDGPPALNCPQPLVPRINLGLVEYLEVNGSPDQCEGPYFVTPTICGDCNVIGSNVAPSFWTED